MLGPDVNLDAMSVPAIRVAIRQINGWTLAKTVIQWKGCGQCVRRDGKVQMVELAVGVAYLPGEDLVVVSALIICNEVEW